jgi:toxin-antitoxin system PIN domain toxin
VKERAAATGRTASGFLRVVTHPRGFRDPGPVADAPAFAQALRDSSAVIRLEAGERHWTIVTHLCRSIGAQANRVADAFLAASAIEHGATWSTADRGFARFPGLRVRHPLDGP